MGFVRNNLTGVEFLEFYGESVHGEVKFGKFKANPMQSSATFEKSIFEFNLNEKHLKGCTQTSNEGRKSSSDQQPLFTVKRPFKVKNIGQTSFYVKSFDIEGSLCEGYGFKVLNCEPFNLEPDETHEVHIAFTPDFTLSRISRRLTMKTTVRHLEALNYTLVATVPSHMLMPCSRMLPRPSWEIYMYWCLNIFMVIILGLTVFVAIFEADRILSTSYCTPLLQIDERGQVLDLRTVAEYVHRELNGNSSTTSPHNNVRYRGGSQTAATSGGHGHHPGGGISGSQPGGGISGSTSTVSNNHPPGGGQLHQSPLVRPPIFTRLLSVVRGFLRSFGIRIWECLWLLPIPNIVALFTLSSRPKNHRQEHLEEVGEEDPDDKSGAEIKGDKKPQPQAQLQNHQHQNNKKQPKPKRTVSRKKSLPTVLAGNSNHNNSSNNDLDEASSTTTESSAVDDLNDNTTPNQNNKQQNSEQGKNSKKKTTQKSTQVKNNSEQQQQNNSSNATTSSKKKAKEQNSVEGKKTSPERSIGSNSNSETIAKVAPVTGSNKKTTPVAPLPNKPRQNVQSAQDLNNQNLQHQPLQNLSQQNNQLTNSTENNGVQQKKVTPVGKILPAIKPPENHGAQFGPVGAKPPMKPSWNNSGRNNDLNDVHGNGYGVPGNHGQGGPQTGNGNPSEDMFTGSNSNGSSPSRGGPSLMTQLQMNRKQETAQFLAGLTRNDWPGFSESTPTSGGLQNPENFLISLWDTPDTTQTIGQQPTNIWGNNGLWSDAGLGRGNQQHNATPTSTNYIGGLSVLGGGAQTQQAPPSSAPQQNYQFLRSDLNHDSAEILRRNNLAGNLNPTTQQNDTGPSTGNGFNGFNPLGMTSIWSNTQNNSSNEMGQNPQIARNTSSPDELNNKFQQGSRALNLQAQSTSVTTVASTPAATAPSMNTTNSWSNTLFRNKQ